VAENFNRLVQLLDLERLFQNGSGSPPSGPSRRPRRKWAPVTRAVFESKVAINVIDVVKPENA